MYTSFDEKSLAEAVILIKDQSDNGKRWRLNTPGFNQVEKNESGYQLKAPNGSSMQVTFLPTSQTVALDRGMLRYGGETQRNNNGIWYQNQSYPNSQYIDFFCDKEVLAVITLQPKGEVHPKAILKEKAQIIRVGELEIALPKFPNTASERN